MEPRRFVISSLHLHLHPFYRFVRYTHFEQPELLLVIIGDISAN